VNHILDNKLSLNIDGLAGTGKSTLVNQLQAELKARDLKYVAVAPSNKAARRIQGMTLHKFIKKHPSKIIRELNIDYMIVDEISMVHEIFHKYLLVLQRMKPNLKFIIAGNFDQLLPIQDRVSNVDYESSVALHDLCEGNRLKLMTCRRSDDVCFKKVHPANIPNLTKADFDNKLTGRHLSYTNKKRKEVNHLMMEAKARKNHGRKKILELEERAIDKDSQDVRLLAGTPIISRVNKEDMDIYNDEVFSIKKVQHSKSNILIVDEDDSSRILNIPFNLFQQLFYVAYCITIHKSQGVTYDFPYSIHEWDHPNFDNRLKYVALSRTTQ
jgi:ATP-dependent exoDNAse (exonuclease V) alpha subunit